MTTVNLTDLISENDFKGYTGSQGQSGYTGSQGQSGYTGSAGVDGTIGVDGYTGSQGAVGYTGSAGTGGGGSGLQTKTMDYTGTLVTFTGTKRWWINGDYTISNLYAFVITPAVGANIDLSVNKNGTLAETISITANVNSSVKAANVSLALGDYITVDVTQVGSTTAGADLSLIFEYS